MPSTKPVSVRASGMRFEPTAAIIERVIVCMAPV